MKKQQCIALSAAHMSLNAECVHVGIYNKFHVNVVVFNYWMNDT